MPAPPQSPSSPAAILQRRIIVTGSAGFIGSHLAEQLVSEPQNTVLSIDKLTYSGHLQNLSAVADHANHSFLKADICDRAQMRSVVAQFKPDAIINLAAETHVDRSIDAPEQFLKTNVEGTCSLLDAALAHWQDERSPHFRYLQVSTDEVYGTLGESGLFTESTPYQPNSPYAASKASADLFVRAWQETYGLPTLITNCSNNFGPRQFPEKLIPLIIAKAQKDEPIPVYGDGKQVRDWIFVSDHASGIIAALHDGTPGSCYNIGSHCEKTNIELLLQVLQAIAKQTGKPLEQLKQLITHVTDRPGHDRRYALDASKAHAELGWAPATSFEAAIDTTVAWYLENPDWFANADHDYQQERLGLARHGNP
ncbi:MAG: dTDP-glucose 4,6-dehydratase [Pseudomonadales bacterium]